MVSALAKTMPRRISRSELPIARLEPRIRLAWILVVPISPRTILEEPSGRLGTMPDAMPGSTPIRQMAPMKHASMASTARLISIETLSVEPALITPTTSGPMARLIV